jgi:hypothetical protein
LIKHRWPFIILGKWKNHKHSWIAHILLEKQEIRFSRWMRTFKAGLFPSTFQIIIKISINMRPSLLFPILCLLFSCSTKKTVNTTASVPDSFEELTIDSNSDDCIEAPDASFEQTVTGCSQGFFKVISDQFVLGISPDFELQKGECRERQIEVDDAPGIAELRIFKKGEASLMNICTGAFNTQAPEPLKRLSKCLGKLTIERHATDTPNDPESSIMSIHIEQLIFVDLDTYEEIVIRDELFWKVVDRGMVK